MECFKRIISHFVIGREKSDADLRQSALGIGLLWLFFLDDRVGLLKEPKHTLPCKNQYIWKGIWKNLKYKHCEGIEGVSGNGSPVITVWQRCPYCFGISLCHDIIFFLICKGINVHYDFCHSPHTDFSWSFEACISKAQYNFEKQYFLLIILKTIFKKNQFKSKINLA